MNLRPRRSRAFTLVEISFSTAIFALLGLVVYGVASEGLYAFSRNVSINRSYGEARRALDRIGLAVQTAGFKPQLLDATGAVATTTPAAGVRVWCYGGKPCFDITTTPTLTANTLTLNLYQPGTTVSSPPGILQPPPSKGDLITIDELGFQAVATNVTTTATTATVTFSGTVASNSTATSIPTKPSGYSYSCLDWTSVAIIAVTAPQTTATGVVTVSQLRYYSPYIPGATTALTTAMINNPSNYKVLTNLTLLVAGIAPPLPFSLTGSSVNVDIYAEAPDYNNRNLGTANTYTLLTTAYCPRNPSIINNPY